jgi:hypothetical protein
VRAPVAIVAMVLGVSAAQGQDTECRSPDPAAQPCFSQVVNNGWEPDLRRGVQGLGYVLAHRDGITLECIRLRDDLTGKIVEKPCTIAQAVIGPQTQPSK